MKTYIRRQQHKNILNTKTQNKKNHHRSIDLERSVTQSYWRVLNKNLADIRVSKIPQGNIVNGL